MSLPDFSDFKQAQLKAWKYVFDQLAKQSENIKQLDKRIVELEAQK